VPHIHGNQRVISHIGLGSMGTALPEGIGACIGAGETTIICEGDGSLQHNIQELALLKQYNLPIKLIIDSNKGYRQISTMQNSHFDGRHAGCSEQSGIVFPDLEKLSDAYGIKYLRIEQASDMKQIIEEALSDDVPTIVEMITTADDEYLPVVKSQLNADGSMQTPSLEILFPFLSEEEHLENMKVPE
jgi:acetolactate synthase-1/2/3 large subunit